MGQLVVMNLGMGQCKNEEALGQGRNVSVMLRKGQHSQGETIVQEISECDE